MAKHIFTSQINWPGGRNAVGKLETGALQEKISIPSVMDGPCGDESRRNALGRCKYLLYDYTSSFT